MSDAVEILWSTAGQNLPSLGARSLVDVSDGDTPNIRMPIRMLSIDTPEVTARSEKGATRVDVEFAELAEWIKDGTVPLSREFRDHILPKLEDTKAGSLQYQQGKEASAFYKAQVDKRLSRPTSNRKRKLFVRSADTPFDNYGRLLAYVSPSYSRKERDGMTREERATFNLDFMKLGQYANELSLPGYEYRMCEKLHKIGKRINKGEKLSFPEKLTWRSRYCADMRNRSLHGPEDYMKIEEPYRLWIWPDDVRDAIAELNLIPKGF